MAHPDKVPEGGKFRAVAAASIDGEAGVFGDGDLLCVALDGSGELVLSDGTDVAGVIWTREGKRKPDATNYKQVIGGKTYTVFHTAEIVEMQTGASTPSAGDALYGAAAGDVTTTPGAGAIFLGWIDATGERLILRTRALADGT